jgi:hypothetical protein
LKLISDNTGLQNGLTALVCGQNYSTFAIGGVLFFADSFVVKVSVVFRMNIFAENPAHRKSAKR